jgi:hypothetical protein
MKYYGSYIENGNMKRKRKVLNLPWFWKTVKFDVSFQVFSPFAYMKAEVLGFQTSY